jgi:ferredoxin-NADP reductase
VGGTGITPAHQFIEHQLTSLPPSTLVPKLSIIYSSPTPNTILLQPALDKFALDYPGKLSLHYLVDRLDSDEGGKATAAAAAIGKTVGRVEKKHLLEWIGDGKVEQGHRKVVVVCGSEG